MLRANWRTRRGTDSAPTCSWPTRRAPLLVHLLPVTPLTGFWLLAVASLAGAVVAFVWMLVCLGLPHRSAAAAGIALVCLGPAIGLPLRFFAQVDPLAFFLLTLSMGATVHRRGALLVASLVLLAATKEIVVLGILFAAALTFERRDHQLTPWVAAGSALAVVVLLGIRVAIPLDQPYSWTSEFRAYWVPFSTSELLRALVRVSGLTWHVLLPLAALQLVHPQRALRRLAFATVIAGATAQMIIADSSARVVAAGFPALLAVAAFEIEWIAGRLRVEPSRLWLAAAVVGLPWTFSHVVRLPVPLLGWASGVVAAGTVLLTGWALVRSERTVAS